MHHQEVVLLLEAIQFFSEASYNGRENKEETLSQNVYVYLTKKLPQRMYQQREACNKEEVVVRIVNYFIATSLLER